MKPESGKSILGIGNALTDILALLPNDELLKRYHLPPGSMQHVDAATAEKIWQTLRPMGVQYVAGGCAANTIAGAAVLGMRAGFIGKVGDDELGSLFYADQKRNGIEPYLLKGTQASGRAMVFVLEADSDRTFAVHLGAALELVPEDLDPAVFTGYDYFHIEGYLVQNQALLRRAVQLAQEAGMIISMDMASYNVVESNKAFLHDIIENYVDILFANEAESMALTGEEPRKALDVLATKCQVAVVKIGKAGSLIKSGENVYYVKAWPGESIDATGAGDSYAAGFLYAHALGLSLQKCGDIGSIIAAKVVEVLGAKLDIPRWRIIKEQITERMAQPD